MSQAENQNTTDPSAAEMPPMEAAAHRRSVAILRSVVSIDLDFMDDWKTARVWSPYRNGGR